MYDYELKIGWGKSVSLPSQALPAPPPGQMAIRSKEVASFVPKFLCAVNYCELSGKFKKMTCLGVSVGVVVHDLFDFLMLYRVVL